MLFLNGFNHKLTLINNTIYWMPACKLRRQCYVSFVNVRQHLREPRAFSDLVRTGSLMAGDSNPASKISRSIELAYLYNISEWVSLSWINTYQQHNLWDASLQIATTI